MAGAALSGDGPPDSSLPARRVVTPVALRPVTTQLLPNRQMFLPLSGPAPGNLTTLVSAASRDGSEHGPLRACRLPGKGHALGTVPVQKEGRGVAYRTELGAQHGACITLLALGAHEHHSCLL